MQHSEVFIELILDFKYGSGCTIGIQLGISLLPPPWAAMQRRNPEADSRILLPLWFGFQISSEGNRCGSWRQKRSSQTCGQMGGCWWPWGFATTPFIASDCNHWWEISRDFPKQLPHKPLRTTTPVLRNEASRSPPCPGCSFPGLPQ